MPMRLLMKYRRRLEMSAALGSKGRWTASAVFGILIATAYAAPSAADEDLRLAIVAPIAASPFFDAIAAGCSARAAEIAGDRRKITCLYSGPGFPLAPSTGIPAKAGETVADQRNQAQIIRDFIAAHVDGIAVSPLKDLAVNAAIDAASKAGIPIVTFDSDAPQTTRAAFIGTNARDFGRALGASLKRWKPKGGKYAIMSTDPTQPNMAERLYGVRDALGPAWAEITDSPIVTTGIYADAVSKIDHLLNSYYDVDAIISVGAWPMLASEEWREMVGRYKTRIDKADVVLVVADALPAQKDLVRQGLGHVLVGQRPADMGARIVDLLASLKAGHRIPEVNYVGFNTFTRLDLVGQSN